MMETARCDMSSLGHSRRSDRTTAESGLPRRTDTLMTGWHVSKVPKADTAFCETNSSTEEIVARDKFARVPVRSSQGILLRDKKR
jgi:hypothetical protein